MYNQHFYIVLCLRHILLCLLIESIVSFAHAVCRHLNYMFGELLDTAIAVTATTTKYTTNLKYSVKQSDWNSSKTDIFHEPATYVQHV